MSDSVLMCNNQPPPSAAAGFPVEWIYPGNLNDAMAPTEEYYYVDETMRAANPDFNKDFTGHGTVTITQTFNERSTNSIASAPAPKL